MTFIQDQESFCDMLHSQQEEIPYDPSYEELDEFRQWIDFLRLFDFFDFLILVQRLPIRAIFGLFAEKDL